jgi:hypothetical protein
MNSLSQCRETLYQIKTKLAAEKYVTLNNKDLVDPNYFLGRIDAINTLEKFIKSFDENPKPEDFD